MSKRGGAALDRIWSRSPRYCERKLALPARRQRLGQRPPPLPVTRRGLTGKPVPPMSRSPSRTPHDFSSTSRSKPPQCAQEHRPNERKRKTAIPLNAQVQINRGGHRARARPASLAGMYPSAKHSRVKSSTTVRIRNRRPSASVSDRKSRLQRRLGPCNQISFRAIRICALRYVTAPALPSWPDSLNNRSDRPDLREPARRLRRAPIKRASG